MSAISPDFVSFVSCDMSYLDMLHRQLVEAGEAVTEAKDGRALLATRLSEAQDALAAVCREVGVSQVWDREERDYVDSLPVPAGMDVRDWLYHTAEGQKYNAASLRVSRLEWLSLDAADSVHEAEVTEDCCRLVYEKAEKAENRRWLELEDLEASLLAA